MHLTSGWSNARLAAVDATQDFDEFHKVPSITCSDAARRSTWSLAALEPRMKNVAILFSLAISFWLGYDLCSYRAYGRIFPEMMRSERVHTASLFVRFVDLIDRGDIAPLRAKLTVIAKTDLMIDPPNIGASWKNLLVGPFERFEKGLDSIRNDTASVETEARSGLAQICRDAPATDSYRTACGG